MELCDDDCVGGVMLGCTATRGHAVLFVDSMNANKASGEKKKKKKKSQETSDYERFVDLIVKKLFARRAGGSKDSSGVRVARYDAALCQGRDRILAQAKESSLLEESPSETDIKAEDVFDDLCDAVMRPWVPSDVGRCSTLHFSRSLGDSITLLDSSTTTTTVTTAAAPTTTTTTTTTVTTTTAAALPSPRRRNKRELHSSPAKAKDAAGIGSGSLGSDCSGAIEAMESPLLYVDEQNGGDDGTVTAGGGEDGGNMGFDTIRNRQVDDLVTEEAKHYDVVFVENAESLLFTSSVFSNNLYHLLRPSRRMVRRRGAWRQLRDDVKWFSLIFVVSSDSYDGPTRVPDEIVCCSFLFFYASM